MAACGTKPTQHLRLIILLLLFIEFSIVTTLVSPISDLRRCGDKTCSVTLSRATVLARYPASSPLHLSLNRGDIVEIKSKSAGSRPELWGGEINGRRGYFPKAFVKEFSVKIENPVFEVPTEENMWTKQPPPTREQLQQQQQQPPQQQQKQQEQEQHVKQPEELAPPVATDAIKDETEIDETDLTDMDDTDMDHLPQVDLGHEEPQLTEKPEVADTQTDEEKEGTKEEDGQGGWFSVFNDFLAKQFGTEGVASTAVPSSADSQQEGRSMSDKHSVSLDSKSSKVAGGDSEVDQTDLDDDDDEVQPSPVDALVEEKPIQSVLSEEKKEKKSESSYIDGVVVMESEDDEEEEEIAAPQEAREKTFEEKAVETESTAPKIKGEETAQVKDKVVEDKETDSVKSRKDEDSGDTEYTDLTNAAKKDHTGEGGLRATTGGRLPSEDSVTEKKVTPESPQRPHHNLLETESKLSKQAVAKKGIIDKEHAAGQDDKKAIVSPHQTHSTDKQPAVEQVDPVTSPEKVPDGFVTAGSTGDMEDSVKPVTEDTAEGVGQESAKDVPSKPDKEIHEAQIIADKTVSEPPAPSGHQPVDIDFKAGQPVTRASALDSSQPVAKQPPPTMTPALQNPPSKQDENFIGEIATDTAQNKLQSADQHHTETLLIDGTRFYVVDGEIADIVPESVQSDASSEPVPEEMDTSPPPAQATENADIQPTVTSALTDISLLNDVTSPPTKHPANNKTRETDAGSPADQLDSPDIDENLIHKVSTEQYKTNTDILSRKVLSVNTQVPPRPDMPTADQGMKRSQEQVGSIQDVKTMTASPDNTVHRDIPHHSDAPGRVETVASQIQPSVSADASTASIIIEGENESSGHTPESEKEETVDEPLPDRMAAAHKDSPEKDSPSTSTATPAEGNWVTKLSSDAETELQEDSHKPATNLEPGVESGDESKNTAADPEIPSKEMTDTVTPSTSDNLAWDGVPPPPAEDQAEPEQQQTGDEPTVEGDPYQMDDYYSRKISDEELTKSEDEYAVFKASGSAMGSLEAQSRAFIEKLPPSIQSLLEQEPLGLSPTLTVLVTITASVIFLSITCFSCLCSSGGRKAGTKDPLVVVRELEEKLLIAVKEKENLEDLLQEKQTENKRMKTEVKDLQSKSGSALTDLQSVKLQNDVLKNQVSSLQTELSELKEQLSKKSDDAKTKDKKAKDHEKEIRKLQEAKHKLEQDLHKKESDLQRLGSENESFQTTIQSLTDQVQHLDTSKQQLLSEADDWKEKVDELKERINQMEQENRQAQETISFKDSELEVMKDLYIQLKAFEKGGQEGMMDEEFETEDRSKEVQEKIQSMMDVSKVNATLRAVQEEKDNLENRLKIENDARRELEEQLECVRREMESSMADKMKAERQCQEAQTKLTVLSSYFKDKELELQRELGEHEALKKQNLSKLDSADEYTRTLQKELEMSKQQVDSLKRELTASERDFRSQIAANEKKAHENWLNARAAERELKETRHEAAVLRQKLTDLERRQMDLIRPLPTRVMPPPGMLNGPPPPGMERSPSRGSLPPGAIPPGPPGPPLPPFREGEFAGLSARDRERLPPSHPARHMPPLPPDARSPPPHPSSRMMPPDVRGSPPRMLPPEARSPPPYERRGPPHPMDGRSPPMRLPPPDMGPPPPLRGGPLPPHMGHPTMGSPGPRMDSPRDSRQGPQYGRPPPPPGDSRRHQSQV